MATSLEEKLNRILTEKREKILPQNIKKGIKIFDIEGEIEVIDTSDASAKAINILNGKTAYVNGEKIQGTMPNNGQLSYLPTFENQTIPEGYTEGGIIAGIEAEEIKITPSGTEQIAEGLFNKVTVEAVNNNYNAVFSPPTATFEFKYCLREIANLDLSLVTSMYRAFYQCVYLTKIGKFLNASNVTNIQSMFYDCRNIQGEINLENFGTVTDVYDAFNCCAAVEKIVLPPLNVTNYYQTFYGCIALKEIVGLNVNNITNYYMAFYNCRNINNLEQLNGNKVTNVKNTFSLTYALENFGGILNLGKAYTSTTVNYANYTLNLSSSPLTHESLMNVINGLYTIKTAQSLVLGANNLAKLTSDEIAIATSKGWNVS